MERAESGNSCTAESTGLGPAAHDLFGMSGVLKLIARRGPHSLVLSASGHDLSVANIFCGLSLCGFDRSALVGDGLRFHEDGRKIAFYANTLPGSFLLLKEVVG